jgi:PDZ domain-containing protein
MQSPLPRWVAGTFVGLFLTAAAAIGAWSVELPYVAFSPGPVGDAIDVVVATDDVEVFVPDGELYFLTVSVTAGGVNAYEAITAGLDPAVDLVRRQAVRRDDESDEEYKQRNLDAMDQSIDTAVAVALDRAGVPVRIESDGVQVVDLVEGSGAAGILQPDDVIVAVDGEPVQLSGDIGVVIGELSPGDSVEIDIERNGEPMSVEVELTASEDGSRTLIGILAQTANPRYPISIETSNVGGPSAGMMYTLAIMDLLVDGDLAKGNLVAGTGTIRADGTVGNIGGVRQKVVAAEAAGAGVMLVPAGNYEEALTAPRESIELISVATIDEALAALEALDPA